MFDLINGPMQGLGGGSGRKGGNAGHDGFLETATIVPSTPMGRGDPIRKAVDGLIKVMDSRTFSPGSFAYLLESAGDPYCIEFMKVIDAFLDLAIIRYDNDGYRSYAERDEVGVVAHRIKDAINQYGQEA